MLSVSVLCVLMQSVVVLNIIILREAMLNNIMHSFVMICVIMQNVVVLNVIILKEAILNNDILSIVMPSVIMLIVILPNVAAPLCTSTHIVAVFKPIL
jgi:hypothetical protein